MNVRFEAPGAEAFYDTEFEPCVGERIAISMQDERTYEYRDVRGVISARRWQTVRSSTGYGIGRGEAHFPTLLQLICEIQEDA